MRRKIIFSTGKNAFLDDFLKNLQKVEKKNIPHKILRKKSPPPTQNKTPQKRKWRKKNKIQI